MPPLAPGSSGRQSGASRRTWVATLIRFVIIGVLFYFILRTLWRNWDQLRDYEFAVNWRLIGLSYTAFGLYLVNRSLIWHYLTQKAACGIPLAKAMPAWFYSLLGKYIPGKVFMLAGRVHFYRQEGIPAVRVGMCFVFEMLCVLLAAFLVLLIAPLLAPVEMLTRYRIPAVVLLLVFFVAIRPRHLELLINPLLRMAKRAPVELQVRYRDVLTLVLLYTLNWTLLGLGFFLFVRSIHVVPISYVVYMAGSFALATTAGILALFAPAGIGVREGVLMLALTAIMPEAMAAIISLAARIWMTAGELLAVGLVALVFRGRQDLPERGSSVQVEDGPGS